MTVFDVPLDETGLKELATVRKQHCGTVPLGLEPPSSKQAGRVRPTPGPYMLGLTPNPRG
jgi:hypothetical protein